ncbi:MAG TPA: hypothetical protein VLM79_16915 [Kofleriaceae bacterium]|nr:hypothetical protein [Kofleriaceae bacterium]
MGDDPRGHDSDVTVTKLAPDGTPLWSRVIGTRFEDEPVQDGPLTHSGDGDPSQIRSTGVVDVTTVAP